MSIILIIDVGWVSLHVPAPGVIALSNLVWQDQATLLLKCNYDCYNITQNVNLYSLDFGSVPCYTMGYVEEAQTQV